MICHVALGTLLHCDVLLSLAAQYYHNVSPAAIVFLILPCCNVSLSLTAQYYCNISPAAIVFLPNAIYHGWCMPLICLLLFGFPWLTSIQDLLCWPQDTPVLWCLTFACCSLLPQCLTSCYYFLAEQHISLSMYASLFAFLSLAAHVALHSRHFWTRFWTWDSNIATKLDYAIHLPSCLWHHSSMRGSCCSALHRAMWIYCRQCHPMPEQHSLLSDSKGVHPSNR